MSYHISQIAVMREIEPMGLDEKKPIISWRFISDANNMNRLVVELR